MDQVAFGGGADCHSRSATPELDAVADQVLEQLDQLRLVTDDAGQGLARDPGLALPDLHLKAYEGQLEGSVGVGRDQRLALSVHPRVDEEIADQDLHPPGAVDREAD